MTLEIPDAQFRSLPHSVCGGRLTTVQGNPLPARQSAYAASTKLYWSPYRGNRIGLYDGSVWRVKKFNELSINLTDTQAGDLISGSTTVSNLNDVSQVSGLMLVSGTGIPANTWVASRPDDHTVVLNNAATVTGRRDITFALPVDSNIDVFAHLDEAYNPKLSFYIPWTNGYQRSVWDVDWYDGVLVLANKSGSPYMVPTLRYLGTIRTNPTTAGYTQFTYDISGNVMRRHLWNLYNQEYYPLLTYNTTTSWSCTATTAQEYRGGTNQVRGTFVVGMPWPTNYNVGQAQWGTVTTTGYQVILYTQIFINDGSANALLWYTAKQTHDLTTSYPPYYIFYNFETATVPWQGYNYVTQYERVGSGDTATVYGMGYWSQIMYPC